VNSGLANAKVATNVGLCFRCSIDATTIHVVFHKREPSCSHAALFVEDLRPSTFSHQELLQKSSLEGFSPISSFSLPDMVLDLSHRRLNVVLGRVGAAFINHLLAGFPTGQSNVM
jgi:hypothetical protein